MVKFKGVLTPTPRGGGGCLVPVPDDVVAKLGLDTAPRTVELPPDLAKELKKDKKAAAAREALSDPTRKEHAHALEEAKRPETRERRLANTLAFLRSR